MTGKPIGIIRTPYIRKDDCPIQPIYDKSFGYLEIFEEYEEGLKDIETFSHIYLLYQFDKAGEIQLVRPTFLDDKEHGVFASRHPCRPNGIGMSIVKLKKRTKNILEVEGLDILNETPLLDIKPYLPQYDIISEASKGWTDNVKWRSKPKGRE